MKITSLGISLLAGAYFLTSCSTQKNATELKVMEVKKEENSKSKDAESNNNDNKTIKNREKNK